MRPATKWYVGIVSLVGLSAGCWSAWQYVLHNAKPWTNDHLIDFFILVILCILCFCLPLYIREDCTVDMSFISILAIVLLEGPAAAVTISFLSTPFIVISTLDGKRSQHIFNTDPVKTIFSACNLNISLFVAGLVYTAMGGIPGVIVLPGALFPTFMFLLTAIVVNSLLMMTLFHLEHQMNFYPTIFRMFLQLFPSIFCSAPIGYFLAVLLTMESGQYMALLFFLPLLLARFSFKLFLRSQQQQYEIVRTLTAAIEAKDPYTEGHSQRVGAYAARIAAKMKLSPNRIRRLKMAAVFHDIGKIGIPDAILQKPGPLTPEERQAISCHPEIGMNILCNIDTYDDITELILHHHERYDGGGYPGGTAGNDLKLDTYILAAADTYDAITSDRPYRRGMSPERARAIILEEAGHQIHPDVSRAVAEMIESGELNAPIPMESAFCGV